VQYDPDSKQKRAILANNLRMFGLWRTLGDIIGYLFTGPPRDRFDRRYGVVTAGTVEKSNAGITDEAALADAIRYVPVAEKVMRSVLAHAARVAAPEEFAFVDLGCGKGRGLVMASWHPFRKAVGVELSPRHAELAARNVETFLRHPRGHEVRCGDVTAVCGDALTFEPPDMNLFVFMYRPFKGRVFRGVLDRLDAFHRRTGHRVVIAYVCPLEEGALRSHAGFTKRQEYQVIVEDYCWSLWECTGAPPLLAAEPALRSA
jgi:SAM-dependent methyltransferase